MGEMIGKTGEVLQELEETVYWLERLSESGIFRNRRVV